MRGPELTSSKNNRGNDLGGRKMTTTAKKERKGTKKYSHLIYSLALYRSDPLSCYPGDFNRWKALDGCELKKHLQPGNHHRTGIGGAVFVLEWATLTFPWERCTDFFRGRDHGGGKYRKPVADLYHLSGGIFGPGIFQGSVFRLCGGAVFHLHHCTGNYHFLAGSNDHGG
jgi:hypothetical protein